MKGENNIMNVTGKITIFPKEIGKDNIKIFETTISHKDDNGKYLDNVTIRVNFAKNILPDAAKTTFKVGKAYQMEVEGFLTTRGYDTKDGKHRSEIMLQVTKAKTTASKDVQQKPKAEEKPLVVDGDELPF